MMNLYNSILAVAGLCLPWQLVQAQSVEQIQEQHFPHYSSQHQCYLTKSFRYISGDKPVKGDYCLKLDIRQTVHTAQGVRQYLLLTGDKINLASGEFDGAHVDSGAVAMLVLKAKDNGGWQTVAANTGIAVGAYGSAPLGWKLQQFGPDSWGFINTAADMHQGYGGSRYVILLPEGKTIADSWITASVDNEGALGDCTEDMGLETAQQRQDCLAQRQTLQSTLHINSTGIPVAGRYPLKLIINGVSGHNKYRNHVMNIPFDAAKKRYLEPASSPFSGADF